MENGTHIKEQHPQFVENGITKRLKNETNLKKSRKTHFRSFTPLIHPPTQSKFLTK